MKSIGIIQPGKLGDLIICLPIANYYANLGYKVYWPVFNNFASMMKEVVPYDVEFIPVTNDVYKCVHEARQVLSYRQPDRIFDIAATFPGSTCTEEYVSLGDGMGAEKFDEFKYRKCEVPFDLKWTLHSCTDVFQGTEDNVFAEVLQKIPVGGKYDVVSTKHSRGQLDIKFESKNTIIEVNDKYNIFYWKKILQNANKIALVDSTMANLIKAFNIKTPKILLRKPGHPTPTYRNEWIIKEV